MAKSLRDQLLQAGVVDKNRATKIKKAKHKQAKQRARGASQPDEVAITAQQTQAKKTERDRALSRQRQTALEEKAIAAQVRQLIERNRLERRDGEIPYRFCDGGIVKKIQVSGEQQTGLAGGLLAIARLDSTYVLIPAPVAAKIAERDARAVLVLNTADDKGANDDDAYVDYQIPDDLTW